jgi:hypothetical protein
MMSQKMYTHKGGDDMQHWKSCKVLLYLNVILVTVLSLALMGCPDDSDHGDVININAAEFGLTAQNAAALAGQSFTFPDGGIFGDQCAGESATLTFGAAGDTFILTCGDTTIDGTITYDSCTFEDDDGPYRRRFPTCDCIVDAQNIPEGGCAAGTVQLRLDRPNQNTEDSETTSTDVCVDNNGNVTIGDNTTPIGPVPTGGTGGTGD